MNEMIERVAREMFFAMHPDAEWTAGRARMKWFALAEEAVRAMRQPTDAMMLAACHAGNADMEASWRAAIDEALK